MKQKSSLMKKVFTVCLCGALALSFVNVIGCTQSQENVSVENSGVVNSATTNKIQTEKCELVRCVDGDTLVVNLNGEEKKVRLIGVDTPESVHPDSSKNSEEGIAASDYTASLLKDTKTLWIEKDVSETDKYGRLLRYVWICEPTQAATKEYIGEKMLNGILVKNGVATPKVFEPDTKYASIFSSLVG